MLTLKNIVRRQLVRFFGSTHTVMIMRGEVSVDRLVTIDCIIAILRELLSDDEIVMFFYSPCQFFDGQVPFRLLLTDDSAKMLLSRIYQCVNVEFFPPNRFL